MKKHFLILFMIFSIQLLAQKKSLNISGIDLYLGMSKNEFLLLTKQKNISTELVGYDIRNNAYLIISGEVMFGSIDFDNNNRAINIVKEWTPYSNYTAQSFMDILYNILSNSIGTEKLGEVFISLRSHIDDASNNKIVTLYLNDNWSVIIQNNQFYGGNVKGSVQISEQITTKE